MENLLNISNRQLKVGELIRRCLIEVINKDIYDPVLEQASLTVSEVRMTPDLRQASIFIAPLFGKVDDIPAFMEYMHSLTPKIRFLASKKAKLRFTPEFHFKFDKSFDQADKIHSLIVENK